MRKTLWLAAIAVPAALLQACGGGGDNAGSSSAPPGVTVPASALVVSAANPASVNGTLDKALAVGNNESGISNATGNFVGAGPNDYCRVAVYQMTNSGNALKYNIEVVYAKSDRQASLVRLSQDGAPATFTASASGPVAGVTIDIANRRIGFAGTVLGTAGGNMATLNGSLEYSTNAVVADRASCG